MKYDWETIEEVSESLVAFDVQTLENLHTVIFKIYARGGVSGSIRGTIESFRSSVAQFSNDFLFLLSF